MSLNVTGEDDRTELTAEQESDLAPIEKRWVQLAKTAGRGESESTLRSLLRTGVPPALRSRVWMAFSGAAAEVQPGMYEQLLAGKNSTRRTTNETQIELDIPRSGILDEATQNRLRRVLRAFAAFRPSCGYVQGQNFIAAGLLRVMHEEDAFWLLAIIVEAYLPDHFTQHMIGSLVDSQVLAELLAKRMPDVAAKLAALEVPVQLLVMRWFLSLWANVLPVPTLLRVYDLLFVLGPHVMPLVGLACFHVMRPTILAAKHADELSASHALQPLREAPPDQIVSAILSAIVTQAGEPLKPSTLEKLRAKARQALLPPPALALAAAEASAAAAAAAASAAAFANPSAASAGAPRPRSRAVEIRSRSIEIRESLVASTRVVLSASTRFGASMSFGPRSASAVSSAPDPPEVVMRSREIVMRSPDPPEVGTERRVERDLGADTKGASAGAEAGRDVQRYAIGARVMVKRSDGSESAAAIVQFDAATSLYTVRLAGGLKQKRACEADMRAEPGESAATEAATEVATEVAGEHCNALRPCSHKRTLSEGAPKLRPALHRRSNSTANARSHNPMISRPDPTGADPMSRDISRDMSRVAPPAERNEAIEDSSASTALAVPALPRARVRSSTRTVAVPLLYPIPASPSGATCLIRATSAQGATQTVESPALLETTKSVCSETVKRARLGAHEGSDQKGSDPTTAPTDWGVAVRARLEEKRRAKEAALAAESEVRRTMQPQGLLYKEVNTEALERAIASARARDVNAALLNEAQAALDHKLAARLVQRALSHAMEDVTKEQKAQARAAKQFADEAAAEERRVREAMQPRLFGRGIDLMALERALERGRSQEDHKKVDATLLAKAQLVLDQGLAALLAQRACVGEAQRADAEEKAAAKKAEAEEKAAAKKAEAEEKAAAKEAAAKEAAAKKAAAAEKSAAERAAAEKAAAEEAAAERAAAEKAAAEKAAAEKAAAEKAACLQPPSSSDGQADPQGVISSPNGGKKSGLAREHDSCTSAWRAAEATTRTQLLQLLQAADEAASPAS
jgi:hypothetical protein